MEPMALLTRIIVGAIAGALADYIVKGSPFTLERHNEKIISIACGHYSGRLRQ
jgi:F0F1-type ATP synthase assembly protein I